MKTLNKLIVLLFVCLGILQSCDYLDIVPDETPQESSAFSDTKAAERFLYTCYSYIPRDNNTYGSIDYLTGDEVVTPFEHEPFAHFPKGNYTASNPQLSYWNTLFGGLRTCYMLKDQIDKVPNIDSEVAEDYKAQADFLIGYLHFLLIQNYGPTILIEGVEDLNQPTTDFHSRASFDESVAFAVKKLDDAALKLPLTREGDELGLATKVIAKAVKAKLLLIAASPLFNGNSEFYSGFNNPDGSPLMPLQFDAKKWATAATAAKEAIDLAHSAGIVLYEATPGGLSNISEPADMAQRSLRLTFVDKDNTKEIIWGDSRKEGIYDVQSKSAPYAFNRKYGYNGVAPTLAMVERFLTKNGLPIDKDPEFDYAGRYDTGTFAEDDSNGEGKTMKLNIDREPRFYAWITFQNGYYEIGGEQRNTASIYNKKYRRGNNSGKLVMKMLIGEPQGRGASLKNLRNNDYSPTGYLNKKGVHPLKTPDQSSIPYIWPKIRLGELYLTYAEACVESNNLGEAKTYLNKVRTRAGIPTVEESWAKVPGATLDQNTLRAIVRQERMVEMYLENQNFWDMRRWKMAEKYFDSKPMGMNILADNIEEWNKPTPVDVERKFTSPTNYLMPIPQGEVNKNINLVQNPGY